MTSLCDASIEDQNKPWKRVPVIKGLEYIPFQTTFIYFNVIPDCFRGLHLCIVKIIINIKIMNYEKTKQNPGSFN